MRFRLVCLPIREKYTDWGGPIFHEWGQNQQVVNFEDDGDSGTITRQVNSDLDGSSPYFHRSHNTGGGKGVRNVSGTFFRRKLEEK